MKSTFHPKNTCKKSIIFLLLIALSFIGNAQPLSEKVAEKAMKAWPDTNKTIFTKLSFDQSFLLQGLAAVWKRTANADYYRYIQHSTDNQIDQNGPVKNFTQENSNIDKANMGQSLLLLYRVTGQEKYYKALQQLREKLKNQLKKINQMQPNDWFGIEPFAAEYAAVFDEPAAFDAIANRFISAQKFISYPTSKGNLMGFYAMALVDVLEYFPQNHPQRKTLLAILNRFAAVQNYQNLETNMVYVLAKGTRLGFLPEKYKNIAKKGFDGMAKVEAVENIKNPKNTGIFILAANEIELIEIPQNAKGQKVMLDSYFNNEFLKDVTGRTIPFHYKWDEMDNNGFYFFKNAFNYHGIKTETLNAAPTTVNLQGSDIYIIVDPDTQKETEKPNYVSQQDAEIIAAWVKAGGVLVLMGNDTGNCDLEHFNILAEKFGIHFNEDVHNKVIGSKIELGTLQVPATDPIFKTAKKIYLKDISTFKLNPPAVASFTDEKSVLIATAKYGKGAVFAVGDPWFYDEYTDGRNLPAGYDNFRACNDLVNWLIKQVPGKN